MEQVTAVLTVLFAKPFWIGLYERTDQAGYQVCRTVFGAEPSDGQVYDWLQRSFVYLHFSPALEAAAVKPAARNPKRLQRQIRKAVAQADSVGTKAQQMLKLQRQQDGLARKVRRSQSIEQQKEQQYAIRQRKKKEKHRGR